MKISKSSAPTTIVMNTKAVKDVKSQFAWWKAKTKLERGMQALSTVAYLKENQISRHRAAGIRHNAHKLRTYGQVGRYPRKDSFGESRDNKR